MPDREYHLKGRAISREDKIHAANAAMYTAEALGYHVSMHGIGFTTDKPIIKDHLHALQLLVEPYKILVS